ncbi:MAG: type II CAAX prenyl endopeptidase Rce1 family protein [Terriglobales bacterium]
MTQSSDPIPCLETRGPIAPVWHTLVLLAVFAALTIFGWLAQRSARIHAPNPAPPSHLLPLQIQAIIFEWATVAWVWFGVHRKGIRVRELVGGRWPNAKFVMVDVLLGGGLWALWIGISWMENSLLGHNPGPDAIPYPVGLLESILAVGVAVSAGVCEEIVFRGYLQRQFRALTGSAAIAVLLQAAVFGVAHVYQGVRLASMVVLYGMLFGVLALWRRSLRPGIIAHTWSDIAARLLHV